METIQEMAKLLATFCCGLFAGAAIYINLVEHPARVECGTELAITEFRPSYRKATVIQAALAAIGTITAITAWFTGASLWWIVGGTFFGSVIPFTLIVIFPTNKELLSATLDKNSEKAQQLLSRWNKLHAVRSLLSSIALVIFLLNIR